MRRFADSPQFRQGLNNALQPWSDAIGGGRNPSHYGKTGDEWVASAKQLKIDIEKDLQSRGNSYENRKLIARNLERNH